VPNTSSPSVFSFSYDFTNSTATQCTVTISVVSEKGVPSSASFTLKK
jgi:hypothetical protein